MNTTDPSPSSLERASLLRRLLTFFSSGALIAGLVVTIPIAVGLVTLVAPGTAYAQTCSPSCTVVEGTTITFTIPGATSYAWSTAGNCSGSPYNAGNSATEYSPTTACGWGASNASGAWQVVGTVSMTWTSPPPPAPTSSLTCYSSCPDATLSGGYAYPYFSISTTNANDGCTLWYSGPTGSFSTPATCNGTTDVQLGPSSAGTSPAGTWSFQLEASGSGGSTDSSILYVTVSAPAPTASLSCSTNCPNATIGSNGYAYPYFNISTTNANTCTLFYSGPSGSFNTPATCNGTTNVGISTAGSWQFQLYATGSGGSADSSILYVTVSEPTPPALSCSSNCSSPSVGTTVTFSATYSGSSSYTWYYECPGMSGYSAISGETTSSPTAACTTAGTGHFYITDSGGTSSTVSVTWVPTLSCSSNCSPPTAWTTSGDAEIGFTVAPSGTTIYYCGPEPSGTTCAPYSSSPQYSPTTSTTIGINTPGTWYFQAVSSGIGSTVIGVTVSNPPAPAWSSYPPAMTESTPFSLTYTFYGPSVILTSQCPGAGSTSLTETSTSYSFAGCASNPSGTTANTCAAGQMWFQLEDTYGGFSPVACISIDVLTLACSTNCSPPTTWTSSNYAAIGFTVSGLSSGDPATWHIAYALLASSASSCTSPQFSPQYSGSSDSSTIAVNTPGTWCFQVWPYNGTTGSNTITVVVAPTLSCSSNCSPPTTWGSSGYAQIGFTVAPSGTTIYYCGPEPSGTTCAPYSSSPQYSPTTSTTIGINTPGTWYFQAVSSGIGSNVVGVTVVPPSPTISCTTSCTAASGKYINVTVTFPSGYGYSSSYAYFVAVCSASTASQYGPTTANPFGVTDPPPPPTVSCEHVQVQATWSLNGVSGTASSNTLTLTFIVLQCGTASPQQCPTASIGATGYAEIDLSVTYTGTDTWHVDYGNSSVTQYTTGSYSGSQNLTIGVTSGGKWQFEMFTYNTGQESNILVVDVAPVSCSVASQGVWPYNTAITTSDAYTYNGQDFAGCMGPETAPNGTTSALLNVDMTGAWTVAYSTCGSGQYAGTFSGSGPLTSSLTKLPTTAPLNPNGCYGFAVTSAPYSSSAPSPEVIINLVPSWTFTSQGYSWSSPPTLCEWIFQTTSCGGSLDSPAYSTTTYTSAQCPASLVGTTIPTGDVCYQKTVSSNALYNNVTQDSSITPGSATLVWFAPTSTPPGGGGGGGSSGLGLSLYGIDPSNGSSAQVQGGS